MAGIGFELKKLFDKSGLVNKAKAYTYSSLITIGPMLLCIVMVAVFNWIMRQASVDFLDVELFQSSVIYAFIFSYIMSSMMTMYLTRVSSDFLNEGYHNALLPSLYGSIQITLIAGAIPALIFLILAPLPLSVKTGLFLLFMLLIMIWNQVVYVSAMKNFRRIVSAFACGAVVSIGALSIILYLTPLRTASSALFSFDSGFLVTAGMLMVQIERYFKPGKTVSNFSFLAFLRRYPSLIAIGILNAVGLFAHQFIQWFGPSGVVISDAFLMAPQYDVAVFCAFLSAVPTLIVFVVSLETSFYPKFRNYYDYILSKGSIMDINRARTEMYQVLGQQFTLMMGIQMIFSIISIALGIRFLPLMGFTSTQIDLFNLLVIGYFAYIIYNVVSLVLLYFDDRKGVLWLAIAFLGMNTGFTAISVWLNDQGFSFFAASFLTLLLALARIIYVLNHINYYTFSAQPLVARQTENRFGPLLKR
ncbi:exopolysaccharide Pel transporter PelG [Paenibacillus kandeliae]|uniref:exopolysaccharide Pel transporter PelG n=1 Tax=Paenibacillus kandeliae TaxID=3231269 RepID=UPI003458C7E8